MNFSHKVFYGLDEGSGTTVSDSLGNGPVGTIAGTQTNVWANSGSLTISNAAGSGGDNSIKLQNAYIDELCDLSTLDDQSLVMMFWFNQPQAVTGAPFLMSYGQLTKTANPYGAWGIAADNAFTPYFEKIGGSAYVSRSVGMIEPLAAGTATETNGQWHAYSVQLDVFDGKVIASGCMGGRPQRGARLFTLEENGMPTVDGQGAGIRLLAACTANVNTIGGQMWGQTKIKQFFLGRTVGEQRNNIPKRARCRRSASRRTAGGGRMRSL